MWYLCEHGDNATVPARSPYAMARPLALYKTLRPSRWCLHEAVHACINSKSCTQPSRLAVGPCKGPTGPDCTPPVPAFICTYSHRGNLLPSGFSDKVKGPVSRDNVCLFCFNTLRTSEHQTMRSLSGSHLRFLRCTGVKPVSCIDGLHNVQSDTHCLRIPVAVQR